MVQDTQEIKEKIINTFKSKGPLLPVSVAREIELTPLFTSAFLSELLSEKKIRITNMKVGNSPVYFIPGQEAHLDEYSKYLNSKEREAYNLLKDKKFLKDSEQQPAIRVALREIRDFAIPFRAGEKEEIHWRYFTVPEEEFNLPKKAQAEKQEETQEKPAVQETSKEKPIPKKKTSNKTKRSTGTTKQSEKFLNKVREFLSSSDTEISSIESMGKNELILKVRNSSGEWLLIAHNKKRITEKEIIKASKKAHDLGLRYSIVFLGTLPKKTQDFMDSLKNLKEIGKME